MPLKFYFLVPIAFVAMMACATAEDDAVFSFEWSVSDSIEIDRLSVRLDWRNYSVHRSGPNDPAFLYSPNRAMVAFNVQSNDLGKDEVLSYLRVFEVEDVEQYASGGGYPTPLFEKRVVSSSSLAGMGDFVWADDSSALFYLSLESGAPQLRVWLEGSKRDQLLSSSEDAVYRFQLVGGEHVALFARTPVVGEVSRAPNDARPFTATGYTLSSAILSLERGVVPEVDTVPQQMTLVNWRNGGKKKVLDAVVNAGTGIGSKRLPLSVSPNGRYFAFSEATRTHNTGHCWRPDLIGVAPTDRAYLDRDSAQVAFFDIDTDKITRPFRAPIGRTHGTEFVEVLWSPDSNLAIVPNTYTFEDQCASIDDVKPPGAYSFNPVNSNVSPILTYNRDPKTPPMTEPRFVGFEGRRNTIRVELRPWPADFRSVSGDIDSLYFAWDGVSLKASAPIAEIDDTVPTSDNDRIVLRVVEGLNDPPAIFAVGKSGESRTLIDLAPHTRDRAFVPFEPVEWKDETGEVWNGLLALPAGFDVGDGRLPLLLQTYGYHEGKFVAEGITTIAYPGRAMLERGFAVAILSGPSSGTLDQPDEGKVYVRGYRSAINHLDELGLIDPKRVGTIGWSRKSFQVKYALTQAPDLFAAAVVADGFDKGYMQYVSLIDARSPGQPFTSNFEETYGSHPWPLNENWIAEAPGFNTHRVEAPVRIEAPGMWTVASEWEFYVGLRAHSVPVDLIVYPDGRHGLVRPSERQMSTQGSVDWLDFWINGAEDPDPAKVEQYERWRGMREERCAWGNQNDKPNYCEFAKTQ